VTTTIFKKLAVLSVAAFAAGCGDDDDDSVRFEVQVENISPVYDFNSSGVFNTPMGADGPGALMPGGVYEIEFAAGPGSRLSFATMFVQSNDLFYSPGEQGIALFDESGNAMSGDVTSQILLWDAGTEINQEPGAGMDQAPAQSGPNTGAMDADANVRLATDDFGNLPAVGEVVEVTLTPMAGNMFVLRIENVSTSTTLEHTGGTSPVLLAPGVWVVHAADSPLFAEGQPDYGEGLEGIAEDGNPTNALAAVEARTGLTSPIAPGVYAVHGSDQPIFADGQTDSGMGLEALAEDGDPSALEASLMAHSAVIEAGAFATPVDGSGPAPAFPGDSYRFELSANPGDRLSLATMLVQSNDLFLSFDPSGIALFDAGGEPKSGDVSAELGLWDAGTEINEYPGAGPNQAPRQVGADTGADESGVVHTVNDGYVYPTASGLIRVTVTPM